MTSAILFKVLKIIRSFAFPAVAVLALAALEISLNKLDMA